MQTILLTGAAGFIGSKTTKLLLKNNCRVVGLDNLNDYYDVRLKKFRINELSQNDGFSFIKTDIEDSASLNKIFKDNDFEAIIHLGARAGVRYSLENPTVYFTTNTMGTLNILEAMRHNNVKKLVMASTSSLYAGLPMPFTESSRVDTPISPYAASKKAAEVLTYTYHNLFDIDVSILRYFTVYGPSGRPDMAILRFIKKIDEGNPIIVFGDGTQSRDFTYINDIADGTIKALKPLGYEIINLGGGNNPVELNEVIKTIENLLGKKAVIDEKPFQAVDMKSTWADISKAKKLLDWQPVIDLNDGLENTVKWYLENKDWLKDLVF
ncbi:MAG: SDR family NAD(P)-dependent oxidoreductase [Spirochaetes bacterium]|nr:SDR family NAD(P)-dependent oxidoreductase [Spirochaetota bacterium]